MRTTGSIVYAHLTWQKIASLVRGRSLLLLSMLVVPRGVQWGGGEGESYNGANVVETTEAVQAAPPAPTKLFEEVTDADWPHGGKSFNVVVVVVPNVCLDMHNFF